MPANPGWRLRCSAPAPRERAASDEGEASAPQAAIEHGDLTAVELLGTESIAATVGGRPIELVRIDGRWFFSSTDAMQPGSNAGGG